MWRGSFSMGVSLHVTKGNQMALSELGRDGRNRRWILEMHFVDPEAPIGGFFEQLC
jgi:hypothetical protein